jgi:hypothetical protein
MTAATLIEVPEQGLGRVYIPDPRDTRHLAADLLSSRQRAAKEATLLSIDEEGADRREVGMLETPTLRKAPASVFFDGGKPLAAVENALRARSWQIGPTVNQGSTPQCVLHAWLGFEFAAPMAVPPPNLHPQAISRKAGRIHQVTNAAAIRDWTTTGYNWAQAHDEWPGTNYDGTSVRAGAEYLRTLGVLARYVWEWTVDGAIAWLRSKQGGTLVGGFDWFAKMDTLDKKGYAWPEGAWRGGHAFLVYWFSEREDAFLCLNSWGPRWGLGNDGGLFKIRRDAMTYLLEGLNGELCAGVQQAA